ncbi:unnamed protein product [Soboliphyme baturini]|uniref:Transthyretin-like family protein n=1 Tax=Soboliphyme baturini TaxID=241478 RepID=A0A183J0R3_9BILA|nr:unnamed protein product [Soboliphyme baturini]
MRRSKITAFYVLYYLTSLTLCYGNVLLRPLEVKGSLRCRSMPAIASKVQLIRISTGYGSGVVRKETSVSLDGSFSLTAAIFDANLGLSAVKIIHYCDSSGCERNLFIRIPDHYLNNDQSSGSYGQRAFDIGTLNLEMRTFEDAKCRNFDIY